LKKVINIILTNCIHKVELIEVQTILDLLGGKVQTDTQKSTGKGAVRALSSLKQSANFKYTWTRIPFMLVVLGLFLASCSISPVGTNSANPPFNAEEIANGPSGRLVVYSGRSEPLIQPVLERFKSHNPDIEILLKSGSNSELANALLEEQNNPQADIFITTEVFTIQALQQAGILQGYSSEAAAGLPSRAIGPNNEWHGLTQRARVIMYNTDLVSEDEAPRSIFELSDPNWQGQVASANSTNGSLQAQVAAMRQLVGEDATGDWLQSMLSNDVTWFGGHTDVRKAVGMGEFKLGLVNHYYYHLQKDEGSPVGIVFPDQGEGQIGLLTNLTSVGIIQGSRNLPAAQALVDFLLSAEGQELFASLNYEYPLLSGVPLHPDVQALEGFQLADVDIVRAVRERDETFDLLERVGIP
jgi:iron(III) transport system substrate-binding protein